MLLSASLVWTISFSATPSSSFGIHRTGGSKVKSFVLTSSKIVASNVSFADLPAHLQAKAQMIGDLATQGVAWDFFNYVGSLFSAPTNSSDTELNLVNDVHSTSSSDQRLRELKVGIIIQENTGKYREIHQKYENSSTCLEESISSSASGAVIWRRQWPEMQSLKRDGGKTCAPYQSRINLLIFSSTK